jgi:hypothetical protein
VWFNDGAGTLSKRAQTLTSADSIDVAIGDVDQDGDLDLFFAGGAASPSAARLWKNQGDGTFTSTGAAIGSGPGTGVALGDLDGDGDLDAAISYYGGTPARIFLNDGYGAFTGSQSLAVPNGYEIALGDLDGDGDLDLFVTGWAPGGCRAFLNNGLAQFTSTGQTFGAYSATEAVLGDVDGDGDLDVFMANGNFDAPQPNTVWINDGTGGFTDSGQRLGLAPSEGVALGDLDGDGDLDAFVANSRSTRNEVWLNDAAGSFVALDQPSAAQDSFGVSLGDLDGDGDLDAVTRASTVPEGSGATH